MQLVVINCVWEVRDGWVNVIAGKQQTKNFFFSSLIYNVMTIIIKLIVKHLSEPEIIKHFTRKVILILIRSYTQTYMLHLYCIRRCTHASKRPVVTCCGTFDTIDKVFLCFFIFPVISRNILTDPSSSQPAADEVNGPVAQSDSSPLPSDLRPSGAAEGAAVPQEPTENADNTGADDRARDGSQTGNSSALVPDPTGPLALGLSSTAGKRSHDLSKSAHADEM